jgi:hypothetical protein
VEGPALGLANGRSACPASVLTVRMDMHNLSKIVPYATLLSSRGSASREEGQSVSQSEKSRAHSKL